MLRRMVACVVIAALFIAAAPFSVFAQTSSDQIGTGDELDGGNFLASSRGRQEHAQEFYNADRQDLYGLDGPLEHHEYVAGLQVPQAYECRVSLEDEDGTWMWIDLPQVSGQVTPSQAYGEAAERICRWVDGK